MIRTATENDVEKLLQIYATARAFMRSTGNMTQWSGGYPDRDTLLADIKAGRLYLMQEPDGAPYACFVLMAGPDPTYLYIDGKWKEDTPYGAIHRVASDGSKRGVFAECAAFARERYTHLRIDTHEDNLPMQNAVTKSGFTYRGTIYLENGDPRRAYDWISDKEN